MKKFVCIVLVALMLLGLTACDATEYNDAVSLMEDEKWDAAAEIFSQLGDYKDSAELLKECNYNLAEEFFEKEEFDQAIDLFMSLGDYNDSKERIIDCNYEKAYLFYLDKNYEEAVPILCSAENHSDSSLLLRKILFDIGNEEFVPEVELATESLNAYEKDFVDDMFSNIFSGAGSFTVEPDLNNPDVKAISTSYMNLTALRKRYNDIFTEDVVAKFDPEMMAAHNALIDAFDYSISFYDYSGYFNWLMTTISGQGGGKYSPEGMVAILRSLEQALNDL